MMKIITMIIFMILRTTENSVNSLFVDSLPVYPYNELTSNESTNNEYSLKPYEY